MVPRQEAVFVNGSVHQSSSSRALTFTESPLKLEQPKELCICVLRLNIVRRHQSSNPAKIEGESLYGGQRRVGCHGLGCPHVTRVECCRDQGVSLRSSTIFSSPSGNFPPPSHTSKHLHPPTTSQWRTELLSSPRPNSFPHRCCPHRNSIISINHRKSLRREDIYSSMTGNDNGNFRLVWFFLRLMVNWR